MKQVTLIAYHHPIHLNIPIAEGKLIEPSMTYHVEIAGHVHRRDIWWRLSDKDRAVINGLVKKAIASTLSDSEAPNGS